MNCTPAKIALKTLRRRSDFAHSNIGKSVPYHRAPAECTEPSDDAVSFPERVHLIVGNELTAPCLLQTFVHGGTLLLAHQVDSSATRFDFARNFDQFLLIFGRPGAHAFQCSVDLCLGHAQITSSVLSSVSP